MGLMEQTSRRSPRTFRGTLGRPPPFPASSLSMSLCRIVAMLLVHRSYHLAGLVSAGGDPPHHHTSTGAPALVTLRPYRVLAVGSGRKPTIFEATARQRGRSHVERMAGGATAGNRRTSASCIDCRRPGDRADTVPRAATDVVDSRHDRARGGRNSRQVRARRSR